MISFLSNQECICWIYKLCCIDIVYIESKSSFFFFEDYFAIILIHAIENVSRYKLDIILIILGF